MPQNLRKSRVVVPRCAPKVVFTVSKHRCACTACSTVAAAIEDAVEVLDGPFTIDVLGVWGVDDFEAMV